MQLTSLETVLITGFSAIVGGVVTHLVMGFRCVHKAQCDARHADESKANQSLRDSQRTLFRMTRALVIHSNIPAEEKERILNDRDAA